MGILKSLSHIHLFVTSWTVVYQVPPSMGFPGKSTGVGCHFLLQGIFLTQGSNPGLPHCRQTLHHLSHQGSQSYLWVISNPKRWCCQSAALTMPVNLENSAVAMGLEKVSFHSNLKGNAKECSNYCTIAHISHASKLLLKTLQARLQQPMDWELPDVQPRFRKGSGTRNQIANIHWISKKVREFQKYTYFCFIDYTKAFDCVDHNKLENS